VNDGSKIVTIALAVGLVCLVVIVLVVVSRLT
jgi:hypothetical protein